MIDCKETIPMEYMEADFRKFGLNSTDVLRQLARLDKEMLRDTIHEAGHCVAAWHLGFTICEMNIQESIAIKRGFKSVSFEIHQARVEHTPDGTNFSLAVICLAGMVAEGVLFQETFKRSTWKSDIDDAKNYLREISTKEKASVLFQRALDVANEIVLENWNRIACLTVGAYHFGPVLNGERILDLITNESMFDQRKVYTTTRSN